MRFGLLDWLVVGMDGETMHPITRVGLQSVKVSCMPIVGEAGTGGLFEVRHIPE